MFLPPGPPPPRPRQVCFQMVLGNATPGGGGLRGGSVGLWLVCTVCPLNVSMESHRALPCVLSARHVENKLEEEAQKVC